ncbi:UNVERIFIED_CONTAM: Mavicyanin [Sesamum radiatum]|uniref:Mavicyanin n=1 Tax=Sesamum radiatum TaxID=300843 RepID=A0AAW2PJG5_SESRA
MGNNFAVFEYNKQFHNVVRVTHKNFNACNSTSPYATWATGNDSFTVTRPGHFYFICSFPGHCQSGQKVDIRVPKDHEHGPKPGPSPQSPPKLGPSPKSTSAPGPSSVPPVLSPTNGCSSLPSWKLWVLLVAVGLSAAF